MIAPKTSNDEPDLSRIPETVANFFREGGTLAQALPGAAEADGFAFESRPQQAAMAEAIAQAVLKP